MNTPREPLATRELDIDSLKALAHPLRVKMLDELATFGEATASGLAERLGESSGATSYHLRQLEKHGFVREVEGKGTARERWWARVSGGMTLRVTELDSSPATRAASQLVLQQWERGRSQHLSDFVEHGQELGDEWYDASVLLTANLMLTREQLADITTQLDSFIEPLIDKYRESRDPGARSVQLHFNAFPVIGGTETPPEAL